MVQRLRPKNNITATDLEFNIKILIMKKIFNFFNIINFDDSFSTIVNTKQLPTQVIDALSNIDVNINVIDNQAGEYVTLCRWTRG